MIAREAGTPTRLVRSNPLFGGACEDARLRVWFWHAQVLADASCGRPKNLAVAGHRCGLPVGRVPVDGVAATLAKQFAAIRDQVADEVDPLHATETATSSRRT